MANHNRRPRLQATHKPKYFFHFDSIYVVVVKTLWRCADFFNIGYFTHKS